MKNELIKLASHLDRKGFHTEAAYLDVLISRAQDAELTKTATPAHIIWWALGVIFGGGAVVGTSIAMSSDARDIMNDLGVKDFGREDAEDLFKRYCALLARTDLIDGVGSFPDEHHMGGSFIRNFIIKYWKADHDMDVDEFEEAFKEYYGGGGSNPFALQFGLDNEDGWVEVYNLIKGLREAQRLAKEKQDHEAAK
jgi:hypothetical protein